MSLNLIALANANCHANMHQYPRYAIKLTGEVELLLLRYAWAMPPIRPQHPCTPSGGLSRSAFNRSAFVCYCSSEPAVSVNKIGKNVKVKLHEIGVSVLIGEHKISIKVRVSHVCKLTDEVYDQLHKHWTVEAFLGEKFAKLWKKLYELFWVSVVDADCELKFKDDEPPRQNLKACQLTICLPVDESHLL